MPADAENLFSHDASGHQTSRNSQKYTAGFNNEKGPSPIFVCLAFKPF